MAGHKTLGCEQDYKESSVIHFNNFFIRIRSVLSSEKGHKIVATNQSLPTTMHL